MPFIVCVVAVAKKDKIEEFRSACIEAAKGARTEEGNLRYDICQSPKDPTQFFFFEAYKTENDLSIHQATPHFKHFMEVHKPLVVSLTVTSYESLFWSS